MDELFELPDFEERELLNLLPAYQKDRLEQILIKCDNDYLLAADTWLSASISNVALMGGSGQAKNFREAIEAELRKYLCGHSSYKKERAELAKLVGEAKGLAITYLSIWIAATFGTTAAIVAPIIVLILLGLSKISLRAWCGMV